MKPGEVTQYSVTDLVSGSKFIKLKQISYNHIKFNFDISNQVIRDIVIRPDAVGCILVDEKHKLVGMIEEFRAATILNGKNKRLNSFSVIAGCIEEGDSVLGTLARECKEEAGVNIDIRNVELITSFYPSCGYSAEIYHLYLVKCDLSNYGGTIHGLESEGEDIETVVFSFDYCKAMLKNVTTASGIISLQHIIQKYNL